MTANVGIIIGYRNLSMSR